MRSKNKRWGSKRTSQITASEPVKARASKGPKKVLRAAFPADGPPLSLPADRPLFAAADGSGGSASRAKVAAIDAELRQAIRPQHIEEIPIGALKPNPGNARLHSAKQIEQIAASIEEFGFVGAIIVDQDGNVLAGHGRLAGAEAAGMRTVPCIRLHHLDEAGKMAFALADNRLAELSLWDEDILTAQLKELELVPDFDFEVTGFDTVDLDRLLGPEVDPYDDPDDHLPELEDNRRAVSAPGDLWHLGNHRLLCGDACDPEAYSRLLGKEKVAQGAFDPPYNVKIRRNVSSCEGFREFKEASGGFSSEQYTAYLTVWLQILTTLLVDGAILHVFMDWRHIEHLLAASRSAGFTFMNLCVWAKPHAGMGTFYRSQHELIFVLKWGTAPHVNNFGLGARGRNRSNVWRYPSPTHGSRQGIHNPETGHPTPKPVACIIDALKDCSKRGDVILDTFGGSGTTLIAAERIARKARLIEIDPHYVDLAVLRWQAATGRLATLADGRTFADIQKERIASPTDETPISAVQIKGTRS